MKNVRVLQRTLLLILHSTFCILHSLSAQELYPNTEPASTIPKGALGIRLMSETYNETYNANSQLRNQFAVRVMYGLGSKLTVYAEPDINNHHGDVLPTNFLTHTHPTPGTTLYNVGPKVFALPYPYRFGGIYGYAKYRFYASDGQQIHLRMAAYLEGSTSDVAHDEAEPGLVGDTKGYGGGLIITQLIHRFAATFTVGGVVPGAYNEMTFHGYDAAGNAMYLHTNLQYGEAAVYNLSLGYLLYPSQYRDYKQLNINVYLELMGSSYGGATIIQNGATVDAQTPTLKAGNYITAVPGVQAIINSNTRVDFSVGFDVVNRSYRFFYPMYLVGVQHYFYLGK